LGAAAWLFQPTLLQPWNGKTGVFGRSVVWFVVSGAACARPVRFNAITISRLEDGLLVADWSVTDALGKLPNSACRACCS
jgi:hypothetical protein